MKILCTGDLHLGRRSTKVPEDQAHLHSASAAWNRIVDLAIDRRVDCVALTGDVFDKDGSYIQAYGPLDKGLQKLASAGVPAVAVAGNHDFNTLPQFARSSSSGLKLLGSDGVWESTTIDGVQLLGVSFTDRYQSQCPINSCTPESSACVVLVHADLDVPGSSYGYVALADLRKLPVRAVLLGHVHKPGLVNGGSGPLVLNPGSPQALDPNEQGAHGPWIVNVSAAAVDAEQAPTSSVEYRRVELDISSASSEMEMRDLFLAMLADASRGASGCCSHVSVRLVLTGRTPVQTYRKALEEARAAADDSSTVSIELVEDQTRPALDVEALAKGSDPPGLLAQMLIALQNNDSPGQHQALLEGVASSLKGWQKKKYSSLPDSEYSEAEVTQMLLQQGYGLLDAIVRQQEESGGR